MERKKLIIIGSGPAALTAAIYSARSLLVPHVFSGFSKGGIPGGQLMTTTDVENFPGFPEKIAGTELMQRCFVQAERFGTVFIKEDVEKVDFSSFPFKIFSKTKSLLADCVILAMGANAKRLDIKGTKENEFWQKGVSACATCDGAAPIFRNKDLFVIGGGDSAMEEAIFLTKFGKKVFIVNRSDKLRASKFFQGIGILKKQLLRYRFFLSAFFLLDVFSQEIFKKIIFLLHADLEFFRYKLLEG